MTMQTLSARIPDEDMAWLASLDVEGAVSPSDKLRALIAQMRRQQEGALDYERSLSWLRDLVAPFVTGIRAMEHHHRMHSEALTLAAEWAPQIMATFVSERRLSKDGPAKDAKKHAIEIEDIIVQRCFQLLASLMRLAVTRQAACYNPAALDKPVAGILEIADIVAQTRRLREDKNG